MATSLCRRPLVQVSRVTPKASFVLLKSNVSRLREPAQQSPTRAAEGPGDSQRDMETQPYSEHLSHTLASFLLESSREEDIPEIVETWSLRYRGMLWLVVIHRSPANSFLSERAAEVGISTGKRKCSYCLGLEGAHRRD